jgi:hypothetical protein
METQGSNQQGYRTNILTMILHIVFIIVIFLLFLAHDKILLKLGE